MEHKLTANKLQGNFFTALYTLQNSVRIVITEENLDFKKDSPCFLYVYKFVDDIVDEAVNSFIFFTQKDALDFIKALPRMSALDYIAASVSLRPGGLS